MRLLIVLKELPIPVLVHSVAALAHLVHSPKRSRKAPQQVVDCSASSKLSPSHPLVHSAHSVSLHYCYLT